MPDNEEKGKFRTMKKDYRIKPHFEFSVDDYMMLFSFIPTMLWQPWKYRHPHTTVIDIHWLVFHIAIGIWESKENL